MDIVVWTVLTGNVIISDLQFLDCDSVSAHGGLHADTLICSLLGSFSCFQFMHGFGQRTVKPVERQSFSSLLVSRFVRKSVSRLLGNLFDFVRKQFVFLFIYFYFMFMLQSRMLKRRVWKLEAMWKQCGYVRSLKR